MPLPLWVLAAAIALAAISLWEPLGRITDERFASEPVKTSWMLFLTYGIRLLAMAGVVLIVAAIHLTSMFHD